MTYFHSFLHPFQKSFHQSSHSSIRVSSLFHTKYFPTSMSAGAFHYIHTYGAYSTSAHTNFEVLGFIRSKPQEGRWRIRDKQAAWSRSCSLVCVSCHGRLLVSWSCHLPAGWLLWCYDFNVSGSLEWKKKVLVRFISLEISHSIISSRNWNHV